MQNEMNPISRNIFLLFSILVILILNGCTPSDQNDHDTNQTASESVISIVAAENFYGEVAAQIGGDHVEVVSIIDGALMDPHSFEATISTARMVSHARIIIYNGLGYDNWIESLIPSSTPEPLVIKVGEQIAGKQDGDNEHVWYMPETMTRLATRLADELVALDPEHKADYMSNRDTFIEAFQIVLDKIEQLKQPEPLPIAVAEPVFDYMLEAMNLVPSYREFARAMEEGIDPSPSVVARMHDDLSQSHLAFFVVNKQVESTTIANLIELAKENQVPIIEVTETKPANTDIATWMLDQIIQIEQALQSYE